MAGLVTIRNALPWALLALVIGFGVLKANQASDRLKELKAENDDLTALNVEMGRRVTVAEDSVTAVDAAARVDSIAGAAEVQAANQRTTQKEAALREALEDQPAILALVDSLTESHAAELQTERDRSARRETMMLAQIASRDDLILRQREQIGIQDALIVNLRGQVSALDPPFFVGLFRDLPKLAAAAAVGAVLVQ